MANTAEFLRIMRHAAERLEMEDPFQILPANYRQYSDAQACLTRATSQAIANTYAASVLRMLAAAMDDEPDGAPVAAASDPETDGGRADG